VVYPTSDTAWTGLTWREHPGGYAPGGTAIVAVTSVAESTVNTPCPLGVDHYLGKPYSE
jgi:hypothetical protein